MKKLLDSDWLRAVQFKRNTSAKSVIPSSAKSVTPVQVTHQNSILWFPERNCEESFPKEKKMASREIFRNFLHAIFFMFTLLISNHTVFHIQFEINLHLWDFQKAEIALAETTRAISAFWKTHSRKLIPNWTRNHMITHTMYISQDNRLSFCVIFFFFITWKMKRQFEKDEFPRFWISCVKELNV